MIKENRTEHREKVGTTKTSAILMGYSGSRNIDSRVVRSWAKKSTLYLFINHLIQAPLRRNDPVIEEMGSQLCIVDFQLSQNLGGMRIQSKEGKIGNKRLFLRFICIPHYGYSFPTGLGSSV